jgi:hypothetical protein
MDNELGRIWKEVVVAYIEVLFQNLPGRAVKNGKQASLNITDVLAGILTTTKKLRCFSPQANYTDRATTACRRSYCQL